MPLFVSDFADSSGMTAIADRCCELQVAVCKAGDAGDLHCVRGSIVCVSAIAPQCRAGWIGPHQCPQPYRSAFVGVCGAFQSLQCGHLCGHCVTMVCTCASTVLYHQLLICACPRLAPGRKLPVILLATCCVVILLVSLLCCRCSCGPIQSNMESGTITSACVITC